MITPSMRISDIKKPILSGFVFFGTAVMLSVGYAALNGGISISDKTSSNEALSSVKWNRIVDGILDLDARTAGMTTNGGNVGIGTASPQKKLDVSGDISISSNKYLWSSPNSGTNVGQIKLHDSTTGNMEFTKIWGGNFVFSGWNVVMGYEIITNDISSGAAVGWYYASCPSGKVVLGGSCSTGAGTQPTNTSISGNGYGCYKSNTTTNWQIKATCANMQ